MACVQLQQEQQEQQELEGAITGFCRIGWRLGSANYCDIHRVIPVPVHAFMVRCPNPRMRSDSCCRWRGIWNLEPSTLLVVVVVVVVAVAVVADGQQDNKCVKSSMDNKTTSSKNCKK